MDDGTPMPTIDEIVVGDEPDSWRAAGFTVDDDGTCRVGAVRISLVGRERGKRILEWSMRAIVDTSLDGIVTRASERPPCEPATHPNGCIEIDHVVILTPDSGRTTATIEAMGMPLRRVRHTDQYGAPFLQSFFRAGPVILELIGPEEPIGDGEAGFFGLAHTVDDIDATAALLGEHLGAVKEAVQPGRRIATLRHKQLGMSVATAFMSPGPDSVTVLEQADG